MSWDRLRLMHTFSFNVRHWTSLKEAHWLASYAHWKSEFSDELCVILTLCHTPLSALLRTTRPWPGKMPLCCGSLLVEEGKWPLGGNPTPTNHTNSASHLHQHKTSQTVTAVPVVCRLWNKNRPSWPTNPPTKPQNSDFALTVKFRLIWIGYTWQWHWRERKSCKGGQDRPVQS